MAECGGTDRNERTSIASLAKAHKMYGATSNHAKSRKDSLNFIKHTVMPEDTLQGIALKYGVTTEEIRRINKIWLNDSLYLRPLLDIPLANDCQTSQNSDLVSKSDSKSDEFTSNSQNTESEQTLADILSRIDSTIAETKSKVKKMESNNDSTFDNSFHRRSHPQSLLRASSDPNVAPHPVIMTQGRRVRSSLQRLEQAQDELFEL
uniref:LysM domain-containing protein n=1 Tax=Strigamia maritima TaxID=126957 RepID=T1J056_STRMM